jgi:hypothetical protein
MASDRVEVPIGLEHLAMVRRSARYVAGETLKVVGEFKSNNEMIGTSLSVLYQAATCHRKCHGGGHVLESLCGRAYNLGCAAYNLVNLGFYDEALNLTRGIGELTNFIMLGATDGTVIQEWLNADHKVRKNKFGPAAVRRALEARAITPCATKDWYGALSESYTHITPQTQPNFHGGAAFVGGKIEKEGMSKCFGDLLYVLVMLAMFICRYFKFDDLFDEISSLMGVQRSTQG